MSTGAEAFVYDHIRTPRGKGKAAGSLHEVKPVDLAVGLLDELRKRNPTFDPGRVDDVVLGVVSPVGEQGAVISRTAALVAGLPDTVPGTQINRFCASGLEATNLAGQKVASGWDNLVIAGGVESMSRVPMGSDGGAMFQDPATAYDLYIAPQGIGADLIATLEGSEIADLDDETAKVALEIEGLDAAVHDDLDARLIAGAIPHAWDDDGVLLVAEVDEERVLALIDEALDHEADEDDGAEARILDRAGDELDAVADRRHPLDGVPFAR